jgi:hypothetical protein
VVELLTLCEGLFAHIDCPSIDLAEGGAALDTTKMTIRFKQGTKITKPEGENVPDSYDSLLYYWDGNGRDATIESQNLNDWTVSWRTYLRQEKIPDFMKGTPNLNSYYHTS